MTAGEDRGVQVEARTLSGVHLGQRVTIRGWTGQVVALSFDAALDVAVAVAIPGRDSNRTWFHLAPTDLVTLTDGGA